MSGLGILLSSVVSTALALGATRGSPLTAAFRHRLLFVAIVLVPLGTLAGELVGPVANEYVGFPSGLEGSTGGLDFGSVSEPARSALGSIARHVALGQLYVAVALMLLFRVLLDVLRTNRRVRHAKELSRSRLGGGRRPFNLSTRQSNEGGSPFAWGLIRPAIVVPADWAEWSREKRRAVISHECAHIRRYDVWTTSVSVLACCMLWINPMIWLAHRRLRQEAEQACDDCVVRRGIEPLRYARYLVEIARADNRTLAPAMAGRSTLSKRVDALLDPSTRRLSMPRRYTVMSLAAALVVASGSAAVGVAAAAQSADSSAAGKLRACGELLPPDSQFVMELSASWNTEADPVPGEEFVLSFTFGDRNRPELVGEVPRELLPFAQCLSKALTHQALDLPGNRDSRDLAT